MFEQFNLFWTACCSLSGEGARICARVYCDLFTRMYMTNGQKSIRIYGEMGWKELEGSGLLLPTVMGVSVQRGKPGNLVTRVCASSVMPRK